MDPAARLALEMLSNTDEMICSRKMRVAERFLRQKNNERLRFAMPNASRIGCDAVSASITANTVARI